MATLSEQLEAARNRAGELLSLDRELTDDEVKEADVLGQKAHDLQEQIERHRKSQETLLRLREAGGPPLNPDEPEPGAGGQPKARTQVVRNGKSMAEILLGSQAWQQFKALYPNGIKNSQTAVSIPAVEVPSQKLLGDTPSGVGNLITPDYLYPPAEVEPVRPPLVMRSLITGGTTQSDTVYYSRESSYTSAAASQVNEGDAKPESTLVYERTSSNVETIAHFVSAAKQALSDAGQLRTLVDNFLTWGVNDALEQEMLNGDGTSGHFTGLLNLPNVQAQAGVVDDVAGIQAIRKAITLVRKPGLANPSAILMSVEDDEAIDLARDNYGRFFGAGPFNSGPNTLWGLPRVTSWHIPAGTAIVGDFRRAVLWDREQASISVSDSHADFFIRNLVAILGELRAAFGVFRQQAFVKVTLAAAAPPAG